MDRRIRHSLKQATLLCPTSFPLFEEGDTNLAPQTGVCNAGLSHPDSLPSLVQRRSRDASSLL